MASLSDAESPSTGGAARRNRGRSRAGNEQEERLTQVAARMFHERGYDATSIQEIADELGLLKGSLYHYISSKDDLLWAVILRQHQAYMDLAERCRAMDGDTVDRLAGFIRGYADSLEKDHQFVSVYLHDLKRLSAERRTLVTEEREAYTDFLLDLLAEGISSGAFRADLDPYLSSRAILGMLNSTYRWYHPDSEYSPARIVEECLKIVLHGTVAGRSTAG
jgi:AcrR family transcriptional regulator